MCFSCSCPVGFEGPRCQQSKISFTSHSGFLILKPLESLAADKLSFEFMTTTRTGSQLLLYSGAISDSPWLKDFIAIELVNGFPRLRLNLGDDEVKIPTSSPSVSLSDGRWHSIEVFRKGKVSNVAANLLFIDYFCRRFRTFFVFSLYQMHTRLMLLS